MQAPIKLFKATLLVSFLGLTFALSPVSAADINEDLCDPSFLPAGNEKPLVCNDTSTENPIFGPEGILTKVTQGFVYAAGAISVIIIVVSGIRYVLSAGDPNGTKGAKDGILYALAGLAIALFAQALVAFVLSKL